MVNNIKELFRKKKLNSFSSKEDIICNLLSECNSLNNTQIQKILFLLSVGAEINLPFNFKKYYYGPYSEEINKEIELLKTKNILSVNTKTKNTPIGEEYTEYDIALKKKKININVEFNQLLKEFNEIIHKKAYNLKDICYREYYLKYKEESEDDYLKRISVEISSLKQDLQILMDSIENSKKFTENDKFDILTSLDYLAEILNKENIYEIEMLERGIILKKINEFIDLVRNYFFSEKEDDEKKELASRITKKFNYINQNVVKLNLIDDIFGDYVAV